MGWVSGVEDEGWMPISNAPKDKEIIGLGWRAPYPYQLSYCFPDWDVARIKGWENTFGSGWTALNDGYGWTVGFYPLYWMPLPALPQKPSCASYVAGQTDDERAEVVLRELGVDMERYPR